MRHAVVPCGGLVFLVLEASALAGPITQGEVEALLHTRLQGNMIAGQHTDDAAAVQGRSGRIRPFPLCDDDGNCAVLEYCAEDWHTVFISFLNDSDNYVEAREALDTVGVEFTVDGATLSTWRGPVVKATQAAPPLYAFTEGTVLAPEDLSVGEHELVSVIGEPGLETELVVTFRIVDCYP